MQAFYNLFGSLDSDINTSVNIDTPVDSKSYNMHNPFNSSTNSSIDNMSSVCETRIQVEPLNGQTIIQIHRQIKLIVALKKYIQSARKNSVYYNYIINTPIYEMYHDDDCIIRNIYKVKPNLMGRLREYLTHDEHSNDFIRTLLELQLH